MGVKGYKAFNKDLTCRGFQYEEGKTYKEDVEPKCCDRGFHFCEYPLDCLNYYSVNNSVFHEVEALGKIDKDSDDTKVATDEIKIGAKIDIAGLVKASINYTSERAKKVKGSTTKKKHGASSATGYKGASSATGNCGASSATGNCGASSATGYKGASSAGNETAVAVAWGYESKAKGVKGSHIVCAEWNWDDEKIEWIFVQAKMAKVDGKKIKEDTYYELIDGKFIEVEE